MVMKNVRMLFASCLAAVSAVAYFAAGAHAGATAESPAPSLNPAQQLATAVIASVRANNERIEGIEMSLQKDFLDRSVTEETVVEEPLPNGGKVVTTKQPKGQILERAVVLEDRLRLETGGVGRFPKVTYWFDGIRWTRSDGDGKRVTRMRTDQLGGRIYDPREVVGVDPESSLANLLVPSLLEKATVETEGTISTITCEIRGEKFVLSFDAAADLLPVRSRSYTLEGRLVRDARMTYELVADRGGRVLKEMTEHYYDQSPDSKFAADEWKQELRTTVTHRPLDRVTAEKELVATYPASAPVYDFTDDKPPMRKQAPQAAVVRATESPLKWFIAAHVILLAGVAAFFLWRRLSAGRVRI